ncbi:uncharacterized protein LOC127796719 isoform X2 [Diospyros lotus]|uniref:uncharacterized protein LOC127796719 isoform X2 n=1 Tax=Diospyros lotus TaxID=55363 RepID=UPI00225184AB|nr:uncharacterized protein LOC127796719 isoform X2 [Diospyros lotus]
MLPVDPQTGRVASSPVLRLALLVNVGLQKTEERRRKQEEKGARRGEESGRRGSAGIFRGVGSGICKARCSRRTSRWRTLAVPYQWRDSVTFIHGSRLPPRRSTSLASFSPPSLLTSPIFSFLRPLPSR